MEVRTLHSTKLQIWRKAVVSGEPKASLVCGKDGVTWVLGSSLSASQSSKCLCGTEGTHCSYVRAKHHNFCLNNNGRTIEHDWFVTNTWKQLFSSNNRMEPVRKISHKELSLLYDSAVLNVRGKEKSIYKKLSFDPDHDDVYIYGKCPVFWTSGCCQEFVFLDINLHKRPVIVIGSEHAELP